MFHMFLEYDYMNLYSYDFPWKYERIWPWIHFIGIDIPTHKKWSTARNLYVIIYHIRSTKILCAFADMATRHGPCCMASDSRKKELNAAHLKRNTTYPPYPIELPTRCRCCPSLESLPCILYHPLMPTDPSDGVENTTPRSWLQMLQPLLKSQEHLGGRFENGSSSSKLPIK
jgi:hypothetical protein